MLTAEAATDWRFMPFYGQTFGNLWANGILFPFGNLSCRRRPKERRPHALQTGVQHIAEPVQGLLQLGRWHAGERPVNQQGGQAVDG